MSSHPNLTPARIRPGRDQLRPGIQKAYASENDAAALEASRRHRPPQTPSKASGSPAPADFGSVKPGSKQRNRNKAKAKDAPASPDSTQRGGQTPPYRSVSLRPSTGTAFAGATFHASPAPSALPIPSFHAKASVSTPAHSSTRGAAPEPSPPATDTDAPAPLRPASLPKTHESPLDFMFRAHREEKERQSRGGVTGQSTTFSNPSSPRPDPGMSPSLSAVFQSWPTNPRQSSGGVFASVSHSPSTLPVGPAFSTPYQERIRAARSDALKPHSTPGQERQSDADALAPGDSTEALKKFLFGDNSTLSQAARTAPAAPAPPPHAEASDCARQPSVAEPSRRGLSQSNELQAMEQDLRRILKLDLASNTS